MKKMIIFLVISMFAFQAYSQVVFYGRYTSGGKVEPDINFYGEKRISKKVNLTYFALVEEKWSEALVGVSYSPKDWLSLGLSAGIEHNLAILRLASSLWIGKGKTSLLILGEKGNGTNNYWYKITASYKVSKKFILAARAWRYHGLGPVGTFTIKKLGTDFWLMPAYDFEVQKIRLIFGFAIKI